MVLLLPSLLPLVLPAVGVSWDRRDAAAGRSLCYATMLRYRGYVYCSLASPAGGRPCLLFGLNWNYWNWGSTLEQLDRLADTLMDVVHAIIDHSCWTYSIGKDRRVRSVGSSARSSPKIKRRLFSRNHASVRRPCIDATHSCRRHHTAPIAHTDTLHCFDTTQIRQADAQPRFLVFFCLLAGRFDRQLTDGPERTSRPAAATARARRCWRPRPVPAAPKRGVSARCASSCWVPKVGAVNL